jgi:hypothetical protein
LAQRIGAIVIFQLSVGIEIVGEIYGVAHFQPTRNAFALFFKQVRAVARIMFSSDFFLRAFHCRRSAL